MTSVLAQFIEWQSCRSRYHHHRKIVRRHTSESIPAHAGLVGAPVDSEIVHNLVHIRTRLASQGASRWRRRMMCDSQTCSFQLGNGVHCKRDKANNHFNCAYIGVTVLHDDNALRASAERVDTIEQGFES